MLGHGGASQGPISSIPEFGSGAASAAIEDGSESWWSGSQNYLTQVPKALATVALSLSVAISSTFIHQDEVEAKIVGQSEFQRVIPVGEEFKGYAFQADEDFVAPAQVALDSGDWLPPIPRVPNNIVVVPIEQDDLPTRIDEEYDWKAQWVQPYRIYQNPWTDEEIVPQPVSFSPEEDYWQISVPSLLPVNSTVWSVEDELPRSSLSTDGESWQVVAIGDYPLGYAFTSDDEIVPQPASSTIEEDYWQQYNYVQKVKSAQLYWYSDEFAPQSSIEEDYWYQVKTDLTEIIVVHWPGTEASGGGSGVAGSISVDESDWQVYTPPLVKSNGLYLPDPENIPAGSLFIEEPSDGGYGFAQRKDTSSVVHWWIPTEELPVVVPFADDSWQVWTPELEKPKFAWLSIDDEIVPQPVPLPFDEEPWQVYFPPLKIAQPVYLPDPEEIPAGSLIPPPAPTGRSRYWLAKQEIDWSTPFYVEEEVKPTLKSLDLQIQDQKEYKKSLVKIKEYTGDTTSIELEIALVVKKIKELQAEKQDYYQKYHDYIKAYKVEKQRQRELKEEYLEAFELEELMELEEIM